MNPTGDQVLEYLRSYADHFDLLTHIRLNTKVLSIEFEGVAEQEMEAWTLWNANGEGFGNKGKWSLLVQHHPTQSQQVMQFDFVILCVGRFSNVPHMPKFPRGKGPELFQGKVIHYKDYSSLDYKAARNLVRNKRVIVVGFQKSAIDIAYECSLANGNEQPCHLLYRTFHWKQSAFTAWGLSYSFLYYTRFAELLLHKPGEGLLLRLLATVLSPLLWVVNKLVESDIKQKQPLNKLGLEPEGTALEAAASCHLAAVPDGFYKHVEEGCIVLKKAKNFRFCKEGVIVEGESETPIEADLVILATGFDGVRNLRDMFASTMFQDYIMGSSSSILQLYRHCIHPRIPKLGVIGYSESFSNLFISEMRCRWLLELLDGTFNLPSIKEMENDISRWDDVIKTYSPNHYRRSCIALLQIWYSDQLCKYMGWNPNRKKGFFSELFEPYGPLDYVYTP